MLELLSIEIGVKSVNFECLDILSKLIRKGSNVLVDNFVIKPIFAVESFQIEVIDVSSVLFLNFNILVWKLKHDVCGVLLDFLGDLFF